MATGILIVDDDKFTRSVLENALRQDPTLKAAGLEVFSAADGEQGLAEFRAHRPQLVITDLLMPRMDGFALCKAVRAEPEGAAAHIIVVSGVFRELSIAQRLREDYGAPFFAKPFQIEDVTRTVNRLLARSAPLPAGGPAPANAHPRPQPRSITPAPLPPPTVARHGALGPTTVPGVLLDLHEERASGRLTLRRGRLSKLVELTVGHPVNVVSNARNETLGHFLVARGVITVPVHEQALRKAANEGEKVGAALIEMGALTPEKLVEELTAQNRHKLVHALRWPDGSWRFEPSTQPSSGARGHPLDVVHVVMQGLRQTVMLEDAQRLVAPLHSRPLQLNERGKRLLPTAQRVLSPRFAELYTDGVSPASLVDKGLDRLELVMVLEALSLCGGLEVNAPAPGPAPSIEASGPSGEPAGISVTELSEHSQMRRLPRPREEEGVELYSALFDDTEEPTSAGRVPLEDGGGVPHEVDADRPRDSGFIDMRGLTASPAGGPSDEVAAARRQVVAEYLRVQGRDHYLVLMVEPKATPATISAAVAERRSKFSLDWFSRYDLGRDLARLEEIHGAYERARDVLLDDGKRAVYDRELAGGDLAPAAPSLDAELAFHAGEKLMERSDYAAAIGKLERAVELAPNEAEYHATLGWAHYVRGGRDARAADAARPHLNNALAINPDHSRAHEYKGVITAALRNDDVEATFHLERSLDADPPRFDALAILEEVWARRGELRPLERQYRKLIHRVAGSEPRLELQLWLKLAGLYRSQLDDPASAKIAYVSAQRLAPHDPAIAAQLADLANGTPDRFHERAETLRQHWRRDPESAGPGVELMRASLQADRHDAAYIAAAALVARGQASAEAEQLYQRYRPRFVVRAQRAIDPDVWSRLRHPDDDADLGMLFELCAPAVQQVAPLALAELEVDEGSAIPNEDLPAAFIKVRDYVAFMLGVRVPRVYLRNDFGHQIHVGAVNPPILLAGDDALAAPERAELSFRLGRAMTYLWPGRALAGARPSRFLKQIVLAAFAGAMPGTRIDDDGPVVDELRAALTALSPSVRAEINGLVDRITSRGPQLNLSQWARALARTADRTGLLLCGDLPAAVRFARDSGSADASHELVDFAVSTSYLSLRALLGLSIDV